MCVRIPGSLKSDVIEDAEYWRKDAEIRCTYLHAMVHSYSPYIHIACHQSTYLMIDLGLVFDIVKPPDVHRLRLDLRPVSNLLLSRTPCIHIYPDNWKTTNEKRGRGLVVACLIPVLRKRFGGSRWSRVQPASSSCILFAVPVHVSGMAFILCCDEDFCPLRASLEWLFEQARLRCCWVIQQAFQ